MLGAQNGTATGQAAGVSAVAAPHGSRYRRREPERTLLHTTLRAHWKTFLAEVEERGEGGASLPRFVVGEFERYLACGDGGLPPSGAVAAHPRARVCAGALHRVRRRAAGGVVLQRARILPFVHHPPHARHCGSSRGSTDPAGAGASVGPLLCRELNYSESKTHFSRGASLSSHHKIVEIVSSRCAFVSSCAP